jgi:hypothetical protein
MMLLGVCYGNGLGCKQDLPKSSQLIWQSACLGVELAQYSVALRYNEAQRERFDWLGRAAPDLLQAKTEFVAALVPAEDGDRLFQMGASLRGHVADTALFGHPATKEEVRAAREAVRKHAMWCAMARKAIELWLLVGLRSRRVNRDIRLVVAKMLWGERWRWSNASSTRWAKRTRFNVNEP